MNTFFETNIQKKLREYVKNNFYHASHMQITPDQAHYICSILNNNKCKNILEIGTLYGYSALSFAINSPNDAKITCIEKDKSSLKVNSLELLTIAYSLTLAIKTLFKKNTRIFILLSVPTVSLVESASL